MKDIALVLCSFNRKEDTLNCIESIFKSSAQNFDLVVVDNASTDGISDEIKNRYAGKIHLITSPLNNGAGAGFNIGLKYALTKDYSYIMTVDHDILFMEDTIETLYNFLNENEDVAIAGAKFCYMNNPDIVQLFGGFMDYENFRHYGVYSNYKDDENIPDVQYCDAAILGGLMVRRSALERVGLLDESFFIYEEDYDWCLRFKEAGYKVAICGRAKVLHGFSITSSGRNNTFATYYYRRNKFLLFALRIPERLVERYCEYVLTDVFQGLYACNYQKKYNSMQSLFLSLDDALNDVRGQAGKGRILEADKYENRLDSLLEGKKRIILRVDGITEDKLRSTRKILLGITERSKDAKISIITGDDDISSQISDVGYIKEADVKLGENQLLLNACDHIFRIERFEGGEMYIDHYLNVAADEKDRQYCENYKQSHEFFHNTFYTPMVLKVRRLREKYGVKTQ